MENKLSFTLRVIFIVIFVTSIVAAFMLLGTPTIKIAKVPITIEVTAHRGLSAFYPENTMVAFQKAHEAGADWIELDVQETKDLVVVVTHYPNFKTLAKVNKNIWKMNYSEVVKLNVGAYMNYEAHVPTLEEVLIWAKQNNVKLNIELKDNGHVKKLVGSTVDLINKYEYKNNVILASQSYQLINDVKAKDASLTTVYVGRKLQYEVSTYVYADIFSIKKDDLTKELVDEIHDNEKKVYVWTILNEQEVLETADMGVDNIIANDVKMVKNALSKWVQK